MGPTGGREAPIERREPPLGPSYHLVERACRSSVVDVTGAGERYDGPRSRGGTEWSNEKWADLSWALRDIGPLTWTSGAPQQRGSRDLVGGASGRSLNKLEVAY
ncbi:hypothetical protein NDU88_002244 [Pleurodeles waltl]|uniref:Uncharacterized protein n=1 Tax=Pleurodeles waltl TaxID=8319 RepID=A0AAV7TK01_PLEWA|nr:hypothetical protein NDU88_002244 [Pleurodeles waltl]